MSDQTIPTGPAKTAEGPPNHARRYLPDTRSGVTKKLTIRYADGDGTMGNPKMSELDVYITVGVYDDGSPGELFLRAGKAGGTVSGLLDALGVTISIGLQSGVPLSWFTGKLRGMQFEPSGATNDPGIRNAKSVVDGVARWLDAKFGGGGGSSSVIP